MKILYMLKVAFQINVEKVDYLKVSETKNCPFG